MISLASFSLEEFRSRSLKAYFARNKRLHFLETCASLRNAKRLSEQTFELNEFSTLSDVKSLNAHCLPQELEEYLSAAETLCSLDSELANLAGALGITVPRGERQLLNLRERSQGYRADIALRLIAKLLRDRLLKGSQVDSVATIHTLGESGWRAVTANRERRLRLSVDYLSYHAICALKSSAGRQSIDFVLAGLCVLKGKVPGRYLGNYQRFRRAVSCAMRATCSSDKTLNWEMSANLMDIYRFDAPYRWLYYIVEGYGPSETSEVLRKELEEYSWSTELTHIQSFQAVLNAGLTGAMAFLDGIQSVEHNDVLVLVEVDRSPITWGNPLRGIEWELYPSAIRRLRGVRGHCAAQDIRVAIVPFLWLEATSDPYKRALDPFILAYEVNQSTSQVCGEIADAIAKECDATLMLRHLRPITGPGPMQLRARQAAASFLR